MDYGFGSSTSPLYNDNDNMNSMFMLTDDAFADIKDAWNQNIDPQLRARQPVYQSWQGQQPQLQRFISAPERPLFTPAPLQHYPQGLSQGVNQPTSSLPYAHNNGRMVSPAPSQDLTSTCSSARSPGADVNDSYVDLSYYSPGSQNDYLSTPALLPTQDFCEFWPGNHLGNDQINMNHLESFADPKDLFAEPVEAFIDHNHEMKTDYNHSSQIVVASYDVKESSESQQAYPYPNDEGLGESIKDAASPVNSVHSQSSEVDADGEAEDEDLIKVADLEPELEEEDDDDEYQPSSTRTRKPRASSSSFTFRTSPQSKRNRVTKPQPKSRKPSFKASTITISSSTTTCPSCKRKDFKNPEALQLHVNKSHLRPYTCVFSFAGCPSTFATKNEWKRHVSTQHLNLHSWICAQGQCASSRLPNGRGRGNEFNRKDLYTQHVRRMHIPAAGKVGRSGLTRDWEEKMKEWQENSLNEKRVPPTRLRCPVKGCEKTFEGKSGWDERMEHVAKHLEQAASGDRAPHLIVRQADDLYLVNWAVKEGIVVKRAGGGYRFPNEGESLVDVDADGEEE